MSVFMCVLYCIIVLLLYYSIALCVALRHTHTISTDWLIMAQWQERTASAKHREMEGSDFPRGWTHFSSCAMAAICSTRSWWAARSLSNASCFFFIACPHQHVLLQWGWLSTHLQHDILTSPQWNSLVIATSKLPVTELFWFHSNTKIQTRWEAAICSSWYDHDLMGCPDVTAMVDWT